MLCVCLRRARTLLCWSACAVGGLSVAGAYEVWRSSGGAKRSHVITSSDPSALGPMQIRAVGGRELRI
jgi:hypothetical protein